MNGQLAYWLKSQEREFANLEQSERKDALLIIIKLLKPADVRKIFRIKLNVVEGSVDINHKSENNLLYLSEKVGTVRWR
jgi:hypothetical protein